MMITMMTTMRMRLIMPTMRGAIMTGCLEPNLYQSQREITMCTYTFAYTCTRTYT